MAREVVITSVPRGIRLGRTGFQMVMRTAGLRDDVCDQLESLAIYRHLPPGTGPNPACFFHRVIQTGVGALSVLGRIVDAGADYSSRSNKLAHLVAIDQSEVAALRQSSPAAVLAAIEGRLAATWPGGPEERAAPFGLAGMPSIQPAVCATWQQVLGDAGWAGVLADRAVASRPVLVVAPDSSPAWCRRLLALFAEALALVPPQKRWGVTFDTTILSAAPVNWRGTYAGSPETSFQQSGLLVVDLRVRAPIPVPADMAGSPLVAQARTGRVAPAGSGVSVPAGPPVSAGAIGGLSPTLFDGLPAMPSGGPVPEPPPSHTTSAQKKWSARPAGHHQYEDPNADRWKMWATVVVLLVFTLLASGGYAFVRFDVIGQVRHSWARAHIDAWAQQGDGKPPGGRYSGTPDVESWKYAYSVPGGGQKQKSEPPPRLDPELLAKNELLNLLNSALLTAAVTPDTIKSVEQANELLNTCSRLMAAELQAADFLVIGVKKPEDDKATTCVLGWINELLKERSSDKPQPLTEVVAAISAWVQSLSPLAGLCAAGGPAEANDLLPGLALALNQSDRLNAFADSLATKAHPLPPTTTLKKLRVEFSDFSDPKTPPADPGLSPPPHTRPDTAAQDAQRQSEWKAFAARFHELAHSSRDATSSANTVVLVNGITNSDAIEWTKVDVSLPTLGETWKPHVQRTSDEGRWTLSGLPDEPEKVWGELQLISDGDTGQKQLEFKRTNDTPWYCEYVPIMLLHRDYPKAMTQPFTVRTQPQQLRWTTDDKAEATLLSLVAAAPEADKSPLPHFRILWPLNHAIPKPLSQFWKQCLGSFADTRQDPFSFGLIHIAMPSDVAGASKGTLCIRWIERSKAPEQQMIFEEDIATWALETATETVTLSRPTLQWNWNQSKLRWATLDKSTGGDHEKELNWLGIRQSKGDKATREFGKSGKPNWVKLLTAIFEARPDGERKVTFNEVEKYLDAHWHTPDPTKDKDLSLLDWRDIVRKHLRPIIESEFKEQEPKSPVKPPNGKNDEEDRHQEELWKKQHAEWCLESEKWKKRKDTFVNEYLADSRKLRGFLERGRGTLPPEQVRAMEVLVELDSLIIAKLRRPELEDALRRVTLRDVIKRLELKLILPWTIAGKETPIEAATVSVSSTEPIGAPPQ